MKNIFRTAETKISTVFLFGLIQKVPGLLRVLAKTIHISYRQKKGSPQIETPPSKLLEKTISISIPDSVPYLNSHEFQRSESEKHNYSHRNEQYP